MDTFCYSNFSIRIVSQAIFLQGMESLVKFLHSFCAQHTKNYIPGMSTVLLQKGGLVKFHPQRILIKSSHCRLCRMKGIKEFDQTLPVTNM